MKRFFLSLLLLTGLNVSAQDDSLMIKKISDYFLTQSKCYSNLEELCKKVGGRLSGSPQAQKAVEWAARVMMESGADTVYLQECMVPHWVRGAKEKAVASSKKLKAKKALDICALGFSVGTPSTGITAPVVEVKSYDELKALGEEKIKGKIVYYNVAFNPANINTGTSYGETVKYRYMGSVQASKFGALGVIVRSMSSAHDDYAHTGVMKLDTNGRQIPACAVSLEDGDALSEMLRKDPSTTLTISMNCKLLADVKSYNVIGEIRGNKFPEQIILAGGHLDSWDTGEGAHDDGAGIVHSIEILRAFQKLNYQPQRTIRVVAFMNEENGGRGGDAYAFESKTKGWKHIAAIESDAGGFTPRYFGLTAINEAADEKARSWVTLLKPLGIMDITEGGGGADINDLKVQGVNLFGFEPDPQRYFDLHHTSNDVFENVNKRELELGAACISSLVYLLDKYGL